MQPPITFLEKKWGAGYGSSNQLIQAATQTVDRKNVALLDWDVYRNVSTLGRRTLLSLGRYMYENFAPIRAAVQQQARLSASVFLAQFAGQDTAWGQIAEALIQEEDRFIDVKGAPFSFDVFRRNLIVALRRDGELGIILATVNGEPRIQCVPSHRIGSRGMNSGTTFIVQGGPWDGAKLIDGCIVDDYAAPMAYRVYDERGVTYEDISTNDMILAFIPDYVEQLRGYSDLGLAAFGCLDVLETRQSNLLKNKTAASYAVAISNEAGEADRSKSLIQARATAADASGNATSLPKQLLAPGQITYLRSGKGDKIEVVTNDNPSTNEMAFQDEILRSELEGVGWSFDFSHNPTKIGGAPMRVVVDMINSTIRELQTLVLGPVCRRIHGWRVAKAINNGRLPNNKDWFKWEFQGPPEVTADEKYSSDVAIAETRSGMRSPQSAIEKFGGYWEKVQDDAIAFRARLNSKCAAAGVDPDTIIWPSPNGVPPEQSQGNELTPAS